MKKVKLFLGAIFIAVVSFALVSCESDNEEKDIVIELEGDANLPENKVGHKTFVSMVVKGGDLIDSASGNVVVKQNENGVVTLVGNISAPYTDKIKKFIDIYYPDQKGSFESKYVSNGGINVSREFNLKNTTEGLAYINKKGEQAVIMKYDLEVGNRWTYTTTKEGNKMGFKVVKKSKTDDYPYGMFNIKVTKVEQKVPYPGVSKATYVANHKYGLVGIEVQLEDGTILKGKIN